MTVAELIEHLKALPQEHLVVYRCCSDMSELAADEITVKRAVRHHNLPDRVRDYSEREWAPGVKVKVCADCGKWLRQHHKECCWCQSSDIQEHDMIPRFVDVVEFPGN